MRTIVLALLLLSASLQAAQVGHPDLVVFDVGLSPAGALSFKIGNRGDSAVDAPFKVDAWLDGYLRKTISFGAMHDVGTVRALINTGLPFARGEQRSFVLGDGKVDQCSSNHTVKVIADSGNAIGESSETNNEVTWTGPAPCPDLAIKSSASIGRTTCIPNSPRRS